MTILKICGVLFLLACGPIGWIVLVLLALCSKSDSNNVKVVYVHAKSKNPFGFWGNTVIYK